MDHSAFETEKTKPSIRLEFHTLQTEIHFNQLTSYFSLQLDAVLTVSVKIRKSAQTGSAWMPAWPTTHVPATPSATPPTTRRPAAAHPAWRATPTSTVSGLSAASTKTVQRILPVSPPDVSTLVFMRIPVLHQPNVLLRTTTPSASVHLDGWAIPWCPANPRRLQMWQSQSQSVMWMVTVLMTLPV